MEDFDGNWWLLVSNIWTQWNSYKQTNGNIRKDFTCHFTKHQKSSARNKENIPNEKCRITRIRPFKLCHAKIRVLWLVSSKIVTVECYKDSSDHAHSLIESDRIKRSQAIWSLVEKEAVKNYSPPAIISAVKEYATDIGLSASACKLKCKEVANIQYKVRGPLKAHLICDFNLKSDISKFMFFLMEKGYRVESYCIFHQSTKSRGIVFAHLK